MSDPIPTDLRPAPVDVRPQLERLRSDLVLTLSITETHPDLPYQALRLAARAVAVAEMMLEQFDKPEGSK